jgi:hypothetical protein
MSKSCVLRDAYRGELGAKQLQPLMLFTQGSENEYFYY